MGLVYVAIVGRRKHKFWGNGKILSKWRENPLSQPIHNPALVKVVRGHFQLHPVAIGEADEAFAHFARDMGENLVLIGQLHPEHGPGENGDDFAFGFDKFVWLHERGRFWKNWLWKKGDAAAFPRGINERPARRPEGYGRKKNEGRDFLLKAEVSPGRFTS
jgi:hypothetical protein